MHAVLCLMLAAVAALPSPSPFSAAKARAIDAIARAEMHSGSTPGLAIGVVQDGLLVYSRGFGVADIRSKRRVVPSTGFFTANISEQFVTAAVLLLAQQKHLATSDTVARYIPELHSGRSITIAQLLAHTSGLPDPALLPLPKNAPVKIADIVKAIDRVGIKAPAGTAFARNPLDDLLAAEIVTRISDEPYSDFLQAQIFLPLIMTSTFLAGDQGAGANRARGYTRASNHFVTESTPDPSWLTGSADVVSTIDDLAKWDVAMPLLLDVDSVRAMWTPSGIANAPPYGMGWFIDQRGGHPYAWQSGTIGGYHAMNGVLPQEHIAVIVLANAASPDGDTVSPERLADRILQVVDPLPAVSFQNSIIERATEWISRLQHLQIDRTQLTPGFSQYLTDRVVIQADLRSEGPLDSLAPVESFADGTNTVYVFDAKFQRGSLRYQLALTPDGKIDELFFEP